MTPTIEQREAVYDFIADELFTERDVLLTTGGGGLAEMEKQTLGEWWMSRIVEDIGLGELVAMTEYAFGGTVRFNHEAELLDMTLGQLATAVLAQL